MSSSASCFAAAAAAAEVVVPASSPMVYITEMHTNVRELNSQVLHAVLEDDAGAMVAAMDAFAIMTTATGAPVAVLGLTIVTKMVLRAIKRCTHACVEALLPYLRRALHVCGSRDVAAAVQLLLDVALHHVAALTTPHVEDGEVTEEQLVAHDARVTAMVLYLTAQQGVDLEVPSTHGRHVTCYDEAVVVSTYCLPGVFVVTDYERGRGSLQVQPAAAASFSAAEAAEAARELLYYHSRFDAAPASMPAYILRLLITPLQTAIDAENLPAIKALLKAGADPNGRVGAGQLLPLQQALVEVHRSRLFGGPCECNAVAMVQALLDHGGNGSIATSRIAASGAPDAVFLGAEHPRVKPALAAALAWLSSQRCGWIVACLQLGLLQQAEAQTGADSACKSPPAF